MSEMIMPRNLAAIPGIEKEMVINYLEDFFARLKVELESGKAFVASETTESGCQPLVDTRMIKIRNSTGYLEIFENNLLRLHANTPEQTPPSQEGH